MEVGGKIKMCAERTRYTIQAFDDRFILASKPHFATYAYTIIDKEKLIRGPINMILGLPLDDVDNPKGAEETLKWMREDTGGRQTWGVSYRNNLPLTEAEITQLGLERS